MANPLEKSIRSAVNANKFLGDLHYSLGGKDHPNGIVTNSVENARRALTVALQETNPYASVNSVLIGMSQAIRTGASELITKAATYGQDEANRQLAYYGKDPSNIDVNKYISLANNAIQADLDADVASIMALVLADLDPVRIVGDENRTGALSSNSLLLLTTFWVTAILWDVFNKSVSSGGAEFDKQAVAVLDSHTTDCCLRVHGQIVPFDGLFKLDGTPRFADKMDWSPFHFRCRTSIVLYDKRFDSGITQHMVDSAKFVISQREKGINWDQSPANAFVSNL